MFIYIYLNLSIYVFTTNKRFLNTYKFKINFMFGIKYSWAIWLKFTFVC